MRKITCATTLAAITLTGAMPAHGQTIVDTFNKLRSTLRSAGRQQPTPAASPTTAQSGSVASAPSASPTTPNAMVPPGLLVADQSDTALAQAPLVRGRIITFDLRGLKLGMAPREVGRIAAREGFSRRWNDTIQTFGTFEDEATGLANQRLAHALPVSTARLLRTTQAVDAAGDMLECSFTMEPAGPRLSRIVYTARLNGSTKAETIKALETKYGAHNGGNPGMDVFGWIGTRHPVDMVTPTLYAVVREGDMMLTLTQSIDYFDNAKRRIGERAQVIAAARGQGARF